MTADAVPALAGAIVSPRVRDIITAEAAAERLAEAADACRWEAARLIAEELADGKSQRQLATEIGKSQTHVSRMARVWAARESLETHPGAFNEAYQALAAKPAPAAIESPETQLAAREQAGAFADETISAAGELYRRADAEPLRRIIIADLLGKIGALAGPEAIAEVERLADEQEALTVAARRLLREGVVDMPPAAWKPVTPGSTPAKARSALAAERNRLGDWEIRVNWEVGKFINWCEAAGIRLEGKTRVRLVFPERLTYPDDGTSGLKALRESGEWGPDDEHAAALGHFHAWYYTCDELAEMGVSMSRGGAVS